MMPDDAEINCANFISIGYADISNQYYHRVSVTSSVQISYKIYGPLNVNKDSRHNFEL